MLDAMVSPTAVIPDDDDWLRLDVINDTRQNPTTKRRRHEEKWNGIHVA